MKIFLFLYFVLCANRASSLIMHHCCGGSRITDSSESTELLVSERSKALLLYSTRFLVIGRDIPASELDLFVTTSFKDV